MSVRLGGALKELRIHLCQTSKQSAGVREFIQKNYVKIKKDNPKFPILIRECSGVQPRVWARYGVSKALCRQRIRSGTPRNCACFNTVVTSVLFPASTKGGTEIEVGLQFPWGRTSCKQLFTAEISSSHSPLKISYKINKGEERSTALTDLSADSVLNAVKSLAK